MLTFRPSFRELETQTTWVNVVRDSTIDSRITVNNVTREQELEQMVLDKGQQDQGVVGWTASQDTQFLDQAVRFVNDSIVLHNLTELTFSVPANTTLLKVLDPVSSDEAWTKASECFAALDPNSSWWRPSNFPLSHGFKDMDLRNRTMFILPIDPTVKYTLKVGSARPMTHCQVNAIQSYPFH